MTSSLVFIFIYYAGLQIRDTFFANYFRYPSWLSETVYIFYSPSHPPSTFIFVRLYLCTATRLLTTKFSYNVFLFSFPTKNRYTDRRLRGLLTTVHTTTTRIRESLPPAEGQKSPRQCAYSAFVAWTRKSLRNYKLEYNNNNIIILLCTVYTLQDK